MTADQTIDPAEIRERALSTAEAAKEPLYRLGGDYMTSQEARTVAKDLGMKGWPFYFAGRGGVLGPVGPEAVHAVFGFFPVEHIREQWATVQDTSRSPALDSAVDRYADLQRVWADAHLASFSEPDAVELAGLLRHVAQDIETGLSPLAAAWAMMPEPTAERHRVVHWAHVLREQRGGLHITAVQMTGLGPLEAILAGPLGEQGAKFYRWPEPYEKPDDAMHLFREKAEEITDELAARAYRGLSDQQSERLVQLLNAAVTAIG
jgi:hypothetical protein